MQIFCQRGSAGGQKIMADFLRQGGEGQNIFHFHRRWQKSIFCILPGTRWLRSRVVAVLGNF